MTESEAELLRICPYLNQFELSYTNVVRRREFLSVRALLYAITGDDILRIVHSPSGKPILPDRYISISHTQGYAALILSDTNKVGVDIERRSDRVERIASRFIRYDEKAPTVDDKLLLWSAKETVYKLYSEENLHFFDMRANGIDNHRLLMEILQGGECVNVGYELTDDYVLTWATRIDPSRQPSTTMSDEYRD